MGLPEAKKEKCAEFFIAYKKGEEIRPFVVMFPKICGYLNKFKETRSIYFLIKVKK